MNHYPIAISGNDTGSLALSDFPGKFSSLSPMARVVIAASVGAVAAEILTRGKYPLIGSFVGAIGGYFAPSIIPPK